MKKQITLEEEYTHFQESITNLNRAWVTLKELEKAPRKSNIWQAAYKMTIVDYCKPFTNSQVNEDIRRHQLSLPKLSDNLEELHKKLLYLRNKVIAHSDMSVLEAETIDSNAAELPLIIKNRVDSLPNVSEIKSLVEDVLEKLYQQENEYKQQFKQT